MKMKKLVIIISMVFLLNVGENLLYAHKTCIHRNTLTKGAIYLDTSDSPPIPRGLLIEDIAHGGGIRYKEVAEYSNRPDKHNDIAEGSVEEDNILRIPFFEEVPSFSWMRHYYNPKTGKGLWFYDTAIEYGKTIWGDAIRKYREGKKGNAYYKLGRVLHLLQDMSSPPHVFLDPHVRELKGYEHWVKIYEHWVKINVDGDTITPIGTEIKQPSILSFANFLDEMARETYNKVKIQGALHESETEPASGELAKMFPPKDPARTQISYIKICI